MVRSLLDQGTAAVPEDVSVPERSAHLSVPLLAAAQNGHPAVLTLLLDHRAIILDDETNDDNPLYLAAGNNHIEVVKILLQPVVCSNLLGSEDSQVHSRAPHGHFAVTTQWLDRKGKDDATPLHRAAQYEMQTL